MSNATICSASVFLREPATENTTGEAVTRLASGFDPPVEVLKALGDAGDRALAAPATLGWPSWCKRTLSL